MTPFGMVEVWYCDKHLSNQIMLYNFTHGRLFHGCLVGGLFHLLLLL